MAKTMIEGGKEPKTQSEAIFEKILTAHGLPFERVPAAKGPRPDYEVGAGTEWGPIFFEVKEITADDNFGEGEFGLSSRTVGEHIRRKITNAKKQIQYGAKRGKPSILLIYNALDAQFHLFGTEGHDFRAAMFGEMTKEICRACGAVVGVRYGYNQSLREGRNTSFSAIGHLAPLGNTFTVRLFKNLHARVSLPNSLPALFQVIDPAAG
jgi:hypothetical protein